MNYLGYNFKIILYLSNTVLNSSRYLQLVARKEVGSSVGTYPETSHESR